MIDDKFALLRAHRNNIHRYGRLLKTELTGLERRFIEKRLSEERAAMEQLSTSTFPLAFRMVTGNRAAPETMVGRVNNGDLTNWRRAG